MSEEAGAPAPEETPVEAPVAEAAPETPAEGAQGAQNASEQAPEEKPPGEPEDTPERAAKRQGRRFERRLDAAYRRAAEAQARAEFLEKQLAEVRPQAKPDPGAPKLENYSDIEEYAKAREDFAKAQALKELTTRQQAEAQKREAEAIARSWQEKTAKADSKYDDFDEVVGDLQPNTPFTRAIMEADNGEEIAYYLGKNPKEAARIVALNPIAQAREIGKLEAKLLAEPTTPKTPSKAPAPIKPVGGKSGASSEAPSDSDDVATWIRKENARMKRSQASA